MKKLTSLLLCMVLVLSMLTVNAAATENACMEAGVTMADDGTVTVAVTGIQPTANARLSVTFDSDYLTYVGCDTPFAVHSVKAEEEKLTIGLANPSSGQVNGAGELVKLYFEQTGRGGRTDMTVTAERFGGAQVSESVTLSVECAGSRFEDVQPGQWFYEAVENMAAAGYLNGISQTYFGPGLNMNRASFVTVLGRMDGNADTKAQTAFVDVPYDSFYSGHVAWAARNGITSGVDPTHFNPTGDINRAQMVTFLYRYAVYQGRDVSAGEPGEVLKDYADGEAVAAIDWAAKPFAWAVENGIINGMDGKLNPNGTANRAQVAVMLYRFFFED